MGITRLAFVLAAFWPRAPVQLRPLRCKRMSTIFLRLIIPSACTKPPSLFPPSPSPLHPRRPLFLLILSPLSTLIILCQPLNSASIVVPVLATSRLHRDPHAESPWGCAFVFKPPNRSSRAKQLLTAHKICCELSCILPSSGKISDVVSIETARSLRLTRVLLSLKP